MSGSYFIVKKDIKRRKKLRGQRFLHQDLVIRQYICKYICLDSLTSISTFESLHGHGVNPLFILLSKMEKRTSLYEKLNDIKL